MRLSFPERQNQVFKGLFPNKDKPQPSFNQPVALGMVGSITGLPVKQMVDLISGSTT